MLDEETYRKEIVRMWDTLRTDEHAGERSCDGVHCGDCPLSAQDDFVNDTCTNNINAFKVIKIVEKWAKENPQKHKISKLEYDILKIYSNDYFYYFYESELLKLLLKKGYFKGADEKMNVKNYIRNCEVEEDDG